MEINRNIQKVRTTSYSGQDVTKIWQKKIGKLYETFFLMAVGGWDLELLAQLQEIQKSPAGQEYSKFRSNERNLESDCNSVG